MFVGPEAQGIHRRTHHAGMGAAPKKMQTKYHFFARLTAIYFPL
jgi:hypothetical protein